MFKFLVTLVLLVFSLSILASEDKNSNYFKLSGAYGEYKINNQDLRGFGFNYGIGRYFGPIALEVTHKYTTPSRNNIDTTYNAFGLNAKLIVSNIMLGGGASLAHMSDYFDYTILYNASLGARLNYGLGDLFAEFIYTLNKITAYEFVSGIKVNF